MDIGIEMELRFPKLILNSDRPWSIQNFKNPSIKGQLKWKIFSSKYVYIFNHTMYKTTVFIIQLYFVNEL